MNIQFAVKDEEVYLIEVNPRASRTVPFVAKAIGRPIAKIAARVMAGETLDALGRSTRDLDYIAVKGPVFPFARFPGTDPVLGPEMKSTGEVMGIDKDFDIAFAKAHARRGDGPAAGGDRVHLGQGQRQGQYPARGREAGRAGLLDHRDQRHRGPSRRQGARRWTAVNKVAQGRPHIVDRLLDGEVRPGVQHHRGLAVA